MPQLSPFDLASLAAASTSTLAPAPVGAELARRAELGAQVRRAPRARRMAWGAYTAGLFVAPVAAAAASAR